jgi:phytoene dehydrogenase-like protein
VREDHALLGSLAVSARADVVVLGAGLEGLVAAAFLARERRSVVLVERRDVPGGSAAREEFHPGFHASGLLPDCALARRRLLAPLGLEDRGLRWRTEAPALLVPDKSGCPLLFRRDPAGMDGELPADERARFAALAQECARVAPVLSALLDEPPPEVAAPGPRELLLLAQKALRLRRLGRTGMLALARILPSAARDWLEDALRMEAARVALAAPALAGTVLGPRAPGTSLLVFLRQALSGPEPLGGPGALVSALVAACRALGVELRTACEARKLRLGPEGVQGVEVATAGGAEVLACRAVLSTLSPARTLLGLVPPGTLAPSSERAAHSFRARGSTAVLRLALSAPPAFAGREPEPIEHALSAPSLLALERASDALKYRRLPLEPWIEVRVQSRADPSLAPPGAAVAIVQCHTVPHDLSGEGGWTPEARTRLERGLLAAFERLAPGVGGRVVAMELLTPPDIEARYGTTGGHVYDGEIALDQLWLQRPSLALARYATPIPGLYLGGSGSHPGGPFRGGAGALAARALIGRG